MFDETEEMSFDNNGSPNGQVEVPVNTQNNINNIVNSGKAELVKSDTKEIFTGALLGATVGAILCLHRRKPVWLGILSGGLIAGYLTREKIFKINPNGTKK